MGDWPYPRSRGIALAATLAALISVASPINIPLGPITPVPITLQVFFVYLAGALLGARYGALSMVIYLVLGAVGIPVFSGPSSGPAVLFGFSGGYLFAFPVANLLRGYVARLRPATRRGGTVRGSLSALLSLLLISVIWGVWASPFLRLCPLHSVLVAAVP